MKQREIFTISKESYTELLLEEAYRCMDSPEKPFTFFGEEYGHTNIHFHQEPKELLDRIFHDKVTSASCFESELEARDKITNAIAYKADEITEWIQKDSYNQKNDMTYMQYAFSVDFKTEIVGHGITKDLKEVETSAIKVVLTRDFDEYSQCGFYVTTAFPDLEKENCVRETGREFKITNVIEMDNLFNDSLDKLAALYRYHKDAPDIVQYIPQTHSKDSQIVIRYFREDKTLDIYIEKDETINVRERTPRGKSKIDFYTFMTQYPKESQLITEIKNNLKAINQSQPMHINEIDFQQER